MSDLTYDSLKARHRRERDNQPETTRWRVHRALSWLHRAEQCDDDDGAFVFLWVAFNAAYGNEIKLDESNSQKSSHKTFIERLIGCDKNNQLGRVCVAFDTAISKLLINEYAYAGYWKCKRGELTRQQWRNEFDESNRKANTARAKNPMDTQALLREVIGRIYTLRNQIVHGGATWNSSSNRDTVRDCTAIMRRLMPLIIQIIMNNPNHEWGDLAFAER